MDYMCKILSSFNLSDLKEVTDEYFGLSVSSLEDEIKKRKLRLTKKNASMFIMWKVEVSDAIVNNIKDKWNINNIVTTILNLELDYVIKYSNRFKWTANKFVGDSTLSEISDLGDSIRSTIRKYKQDASVLVKDTENFFWISISLKNLKKIGIFERAQYVVLSADAKYFFTKDNRCEPIIKFITDSLGYEKGKRKKLSGKSLSSLLKLLIRKEKVDMRTRPEFEGGQAVENECGLDFTQKQNYFDYYYKCVDNETDINLQNYTVTSINYRWMGDDNPFLQDLEFKSSATLIGNVARIIKQLPVTSIVKPPLPDYLKNFSVLGRNVVTKKYPFA